MIHEGLWQKLTQLDQLLTAKRAKCRFLNDPDRYLITLLNKQYSVNIFDREIFSLQDCSHPTDFLQQLCILAYLINAKDLPLANKLVKPQTLPGGQFFFRAVHSLPIEKLKKAFGKSPKKLYRASKRLDAKRCEFGDAAIQIYILPRIPLTIVIWAGDDEFDARASILFDQTATEQLPLDALLAAVDLTVREILETLTRDT